jgi:hypothetical protein
MASSHRGEPSEVHPNGYVSFETLNKTQQREKILTFLGWALSLCVVSGIGSVVFSNMVGK